MLSHGLLFRVPVIRPFRIIWLITPTQISSEGQESRKKNWYRKMFPKKREKQQQKLPPLPPPMPRLFIGNTCNFSHHKQRRIYQFIITWKTRNIPVNPRSLTILNYMKQIEGRGRLTEGVQYYFINIVVSVKLKKKIWKIVSNFIIFIWIYFDLPVFTLKK